MVLVADETGKVAARPVKTGKTYGTHSQLQIVTKGLKPGDLVLTERLLEVNPGDVISPKVMNPDKLLEGVDAGQPESVKQEPN